MRECGGCALCCTLPAIDELGKPVDVPCKHLTNAGCGIYEKRPQVCRDFHCDWLLGRYGDQGDRPDRLGAYVHPMAHGDGLGAGGLMIRAAKDRPRRFAWSKAIRHIVLETVGSGRDVLVAAGESRRLLTRNPRHLALPVVRDQDGRPVSVERM